MKIGTMVPLIKRLWITGLLIWFNFPHHLAAQNISELFSLYQDKNFSVLQQKVQELSIPYPEKAELRFFNALFLENGEAAVQVYEQIYPDAGGILKTELAKKLGEYYYARGFYTRASEFDKVRQAGPAVIQPGPPDVISRETKISTPPEKKKVNFIIQVGAFGQEENARQLRKSLQAQKIGSRVVTRLINGKNLYCVWVDGGNSLDETLRIADAIKGRFQLEYRILEN